MGVRLRNCAGVKVDVRWRDGILTALIEMDGDAVRKVLTQVGWEVQISISPNVAASHGYSIFNSRLKISTVKAQFSGLGP
jgi:hypothetical protein